MFKYYTDIGNWGDKINEDADCVYDIVSKYNLTPITYIFFTILYNNLNLSLGFDDSYPKDLFDKDRQIINDYFNNKSGPINNYCWDKIGN